MEINLHSRILNGTVQMVLISRNGEFAGVAVTFVYYSIEIIELFLFLIILFNKLCTIKFWL